MNNKNIFSLLENSRRTFFMTDAKFFSLPSNENDLDTKSEKSATKVDESRKKAKALLNLFSGHWHSSCS